MQLQVVVGAEVEVVPSARLLGRRAMSMVVAHDTGRVVVRVLVSDSVPEEERAAVAGACLRERRSRHAANDCSPDSQVLERAISGPSR